MRGSGENLPLLDPDGDGMAEPLSTKSWRRSDAVDQHWVQAQQKNQQTIGVLIYAEAMTAIEDVCPY